MKPRVGIYSDSYPDQRMILNKVSDCEYVWIRNRRETAARGLRFLGRKIPGLTQREFYAQGVHFTLDTPFREDLDVIHTFNRVCIGDRNRWIATFEKTFPEYFSDETTIPRALMKKRLPLLLSDRCLALLPMSRWAYDYECRFLSCFADPDEQRSVIGKTEILYPPQEAVAEEEEIEARYGRKGKLRIFYVGSQMKRKGGIELLLALDRLRKEYDHFMAVVVGDIHNEYCSFCLDPDEKKNVERILSGADWLEYHPRMQNERVIQNAREADLGVLPTMGDTFGFSVLEMQACGCPVITTDRQTMPEINREDCGWILDTSGAELIHGDDFAHYTKKEVSELSEIVREQLVRTLSGILEHPDCMKEKAFLALRRIRENHDPEAYSARLSEIYRSALSQDRGPN